MDSSAFFLNIYPTKRITDPDAVYDGLGSFWTQMFQDRGFIRGYTLGETEELIQRYYDLIEMVNSYGVKDCPVYHRENWYPLVIKKSEFNTEPFLYGDGSVFGAQPASNVFYKGSIFEFGRPKTPVSEVFVLAAGNGFAAGPVIANRVFNPSFILNNGTDYVVRDGDLFFNQDIFNLPGTSKTELLGENGVNITYVDKDGVTQNEELMVLWVYGAQINKSSLYDNFGYIFNLNLTNDQFFKDVLKGIFNLHVEGPSVHAVRSVAATFLGIPPVINTTEVVEDFFDDGFHKIVVTDAHVYKHKSSRTFLPTLAIGQTFNAGDVFVTGLDFYDNVLIPNWWLNHLGPKVALSQHIFLGDYKQQMVVKNTPTLLTVTFDGKVVFPIEGLPEDVKTFHDHLNHTDIMTKMGLTPGGATVINPLDFIFNNCIRDNTALLKFVFTDVELALGFNDLLKLLEQNLPKHVYFIISLDFTMTQEEYDALNDAIQINYSGSDVTLNADGSDSAGLIDLSTIPQEVIDNPNDYKIYLLNKLFGFGHGPDLTNSEVNLNATSGGDAQAIDGTVITYIEAGDTTEQIHDLKLLGF